jgi:beta-lactam-binding protein with PASTA domain
VSGSRGASMVGRLLDGRYRIEDRVARGGMATVYTATDLRLDRVVALKIMHEGLGSDEDFADRFVHEARAAARLNHPAVVAVFDQGDDDGTVYLVMEYVPGETLRDVIRAEAPMPPRRALALLDQVLTALAAAHDAGLVHRDVKPENVLISPTGQVKVADFGLARAVSSSTAATATAGVLIGTVSYLAPELVLHQGTDARTDVYAAGVLLYEMLTGRKPHEADTPIQVAYKHVHEDVPPPSRLCPGLPSYVDALVARCTARDRDQRPPDARVMLRHVRRVAAALEHGLQDDAELTEDLAPRAAPAGAVGGEDDWNAFLFESAATDVEHTAVTPIAAPAPASPTGPPVAREVPKRPRRRRGPIMLLVLLLLAVGAGLTGWQLAVGQYTETPQLTGISLDEATGLAEDQGLGLEVADSIHSETVPEGDVISTSPEAGDRILDDGTVEVVVSLGKERFAVPEVVGRPLADAEAALDAANLAHDEPTLKYSGKVEEGHVISATPAPGSMLKRGDEVHLVVSRGRVPVDIPDLEGRPGDAAVQRLEELRFSVTTSEVHDDDVPFGYVVSQTPSTGTGFKGDEIALVISLGPEEVEVPDVRGQGVKSARKALTDAGFKVRVREGSPYFGLGYVTDQTPGAGEDAPYGSRVTIFII